MIGICFENYLVIRFVPGIDLLYWPIVPAGFKQRKNGKKDKMGKAVTPRMELCGLFSQRSDNALRQTVSVHPVVGQDLRWGAAGGHSLDAEFDQTSAAQGV